MRRRVHFTRAFHGSEVGFVMPVSTARLPTARGSSVWPGLTGRGFDRPLPPFPSRPTPVPHPPLPRDAHGRRHRFDTRIEGYLRPAEFAACIRNGAKVLEAWPSPLLCATRAALACTAIFTRPNPPPPPTLAPPRCCIAAQAPPPWATPPARAEPRRPRHAAPRRAGVGAAAGGAGAQAAFLHPLLRRPRPGGRPLAAQSGLPRRLPRCADARLAPFSRFSRVFCFACVPCRWRSSSPSSVVLAPPLSPLSPLHLRALAPLRSDLALAGLALDRA
jgi:hypothetical protein